ncbi:3-oxoacyl-reductase [Coprinellus micaceus]|uniref:3-oxoacyl-reductase n=1 Tax=Coprinellus micaceus TaxID=71717 RepID=A0A4Y7TVZ9_COPMI|nr:3-oxoacyl-reductase [Coprinellus micaceus]
MSGYDNTRSKTAGPEEHYKNTLSRIEQIQAQFKAPGTGKLKGKVCIITGVGSLKGIGRATALLYAREGAQHLYLLDFDETNLPNLKETIQSQYPAVKVTTLQADAADEAAISGVCERAIREEGRLDVFFANAGIVLVNTIESTTVTNFMETMRINALSVFLAVKYGSSAMQKTNPSKGKDRTGGSIILTASTAGIRSGAGPVDYSASKAAVNSIAKTSAYQLQKTDIRINTLCPGLIETGMTGATFDYARKRGTAGKIGQLNPLGRHGIPEEIANAALFLASDDSSYVNGQNIAVDGGLSASHPVIPGRWS